jgi:hypothetical protein
MATHSLSRFVTFIIVLTEAAGDNAVTRCLGVQVAASRHHAHGRRTKTCARNGNVGFAPLPGGGGCGNTAGLRNR